MHGPASKACPGAWHRLGVWLQRRRGSRAEPVSEDDILRAIGKLKALGSGFGVIKVGSQRLVRSVPGELNTDKSTLLELAQGTGYVSESQIHQVSVPGAQVPVAAPMSMLLKSPCPAGPQLE